MSSIYDWSTTASDNDDIDSAISWSNTMAPDFVDDSARAMMMRIAELIADIGGNLTAGGSANAITVTANSSFTSYSDGMIVAFKATATNTAASTLNVNSIGAKAIRKYGDLALAAGDIQDDGVYVVRYDTSANSSAGGWMLQNPASPAMVSGPSSSTDGNLAAFNGTGGQTIKDSGKKASDFATASNPALTGDISLTDAADDRPQMTFFNSSGETGRFYINANFALIQHKSGDTTKSLTVSASTGKAIWDGSNILTAGDIGTTSGTVMAGFAKGDLAEKDKASLTADVSGTLPLANGGTGATSASAARTALSLKALSTKDKAALASDVSGTLPIANGGTGATTASGARTALGLASIFTAISDLASTSSGKGASLVGIEDSGGNFTATDVEAALAELAASYESPEQTITAAGELTLAHGLGVEPGIVQAFLVCQTAELGFSVGDVVPVNANLNADASGNNGGQTMVIDATNIYVRFNNTASTFQINKKDTGEGNGNITNANWKWKVKARP